MTTQNVTGFHCDTTSINKCLSDEEENQLYIPLKFWLTEPRPSQITIENKCSDTDCDNIGTRFDAASIELLACEEHEKKWFKQMIDLGISCLTSHAYCGNDSKCTISGCNDRGFYMLNNIGYCYDHAGVGAMAAYVCISGDVRKFVVGICKNNHKNDSADNRPDCSRCGEKLKFDQ